MSCVTIIYSVLSLLQQNKEILVDGSQGDVIGESTPDALLSEFVSPCNAILLD